MTGAREHHRYRSLPAAGWNFLTPLFTSRCVVKAGVQLPDHQDLKPPRLETDFTVGVSLRVLFMGQLGGGQLREVRYV